jgi:segregation and condensation protein B
MEEYKNQVEAVLFAAGKKLTVQEIAKLCRTKSVEIIESSLKELKDEYDHKNSSLMVVNEGEYWKITVREKYLTTVQKIVADTELPKSVMETLAVVAYKAPCLQSDIIKIRTNKAYDHLLELEKVGYIKRIKFSRTKKIMLTQHFYDYFDTSEGKLKEQFDGVHQMEELIKSKEAEIEHRKKLQDEKKKQEEKSEEKNGEKSPEIDLVDMSGNPQKLEVYAEANVQSNGVPLNADAEKPQFEVIPNTVAGMQVVDALPAAKIKKSKEHKSAQSSEASAREASIPETAPQTADSIAEPLPDVLSPDNPPQDSVEQLIEQKIEEKTADLMTRQVQPAVEVNTLIELAKANSEDDKTTEDAKETEKKEEKKDSAGQSSEKSD